ncbi:hypothetical protein [Methylovirgula sp. HY1]|uniref:hypothetical protein n=1 Tax=Methylovirgula sp. HY1 TaxID=2822761 RepID=UPI001C5B9634|nr:hypothetical protein [Methylovirgula sp. HY1]QXX74239.1 hypothetical protein MHY1_01049 [Methylovirgula sp. HY1]
MISREQAVAALFARLTQSGAFVTSTRRNRAPENFTPAQTPALVLVGDSEIYVQPAPSQPIRTMMLKALVYFDCGSDENAIPDQQLNNALDAIDQALVPDDFQSDRCTLGGLVFVAEIEGKVIRAPGDVTGKSLALVPIKLVLDGI